MSCCYAGLCLALISHGSGLGCDGGVAEVIVVDEVEIIDTIVGRKSRLDTTLVPWAVFTTPELAGTGLTEDAAKASLPDGEHPQVVKTYYRSNGKAVTMDATDGLVKLIASPDSRLLACHALGAHAADLVQEVSALISTGATLDDLQSVIHIHPTLQELL